MKDMCLYDFVANYIKCGVDKDGNVVYHELNKSVLPNHKSYNPNKENERESYSYSCLSPFATKGTSLKMGRMLSMLSIATCGKMMN